MADILHWIGVEAPAERVFDALTTQRGLASWWTSDVEAEPVAGSTAVFGFGGRAVVFRMFIESLQRPELVRWSCLGDADEWEGTDLEFRLLPEAATRTSVRFTHAGWASTEGSYRRCNTDWGRLMYSLKDSVEGRSSVPLMG